MLSPVGGVIEDRDDDVDCDDYYDYAVNWCVSRWNGRDTTDVIFFFISRPGGLTRDKV